MKKTLFPLLIISLFSCTNESSEVNTSTTNPSPKENTITEASSNKDSVLESDIPQEKVESRYHYDQDWKIFKTAVLTRDIKGMAAFASSDEIDSEDLLQSLSNEIILKKLNATTYNDLKSETQGEFTYLVFSAKTSFIDENGNEFESGVYLYFTQGETSLLLDYYYVAG